MASAAHIKAIKTLQGRAGLDDESYRGLLEARTGQRSARDLDDTSALRVIEELRGLAGQAAPTARAHQATGRFAPVLQALWLSAWHLGIVRSRDDRALLAFVERQTGVSHTRFLQDAGEAARAIEGLKAWIAREGGVEWPKARDDVLGRKWAVAAAIAARLDAAAPSPISLPDPRLRRGFEDFTVRDWDQLIGKLGAQLRRALADKRAIDAGSAATTAKSQGGHHG